MILVPMPSTATSDVVVSTTELTDPNTVVVRVAWDARVAFLIHDNRACDGCAPIRSMMFPSRRLASSGNSFINRARSGRFCLVGMRHVSLKRLSLLHLGCPLLMIKTKQVIAHKTQHAHTAKTLKSAQPFQTLTNVKLSLFGCCPAHVCAIVRIVDFPFGAGHPLFVLRPDLPTIG